MPVFLRPLELYERARASRSGRSYEQLAAEHQHGERHSIRARVSAMSLTGTGKASIESKRGFGSIDAVRARGRGEDGERMQA